VIAHRVMARFTHGKSKAISSPKSCAMSQAITIDQAGGIVLPMAVRRRLNLLPGARLILDVVAQRIELGPDRLTIRE
jgi:AbrB family looped-hinge helix DNA binding protein